MSASTSSHFHWIEDREFLIKHPLEAVWPAFRDIRTWYAEYDWQVVDGLSYEGGGGLQEGQTLELRSHHPMPQMSGGEATAEAEIMQKILKVSDWEIVSVVYGQTNEWSQYTSFYIWKFAETGSDTLFSVVTYGRAELEAPVSDAELEDYGERLSSNWHRSWITAVEGLEAVLADAR
jgi:hypothetical protein